MFSVTASGSGWGAIPPDQRSRLERELTPAQLVAIRLHMNGAGYKRIGRALNITPQAAAARVAGARRRLTNLVDQEDTAA